MDETTASLVTDASFGPGDLVRLVATAKPAKTLTPSLVAALDALRATDRTMGYISKALCYSKLMPPGKRAHADLIRLIKGGFVRITRASGPSPEGSTARRDSPYGNSWYYILEIV